MNDTQQTLHKKNIKQEILSLLIHWKLSSSCSEQENPEVLRCRFPTLEMWVKGSKVSEDFFLYVLDSSVPQHETTNKPHQTTR